MIYIIWAFTMLIPAYFALRGNTFDRRPIAAVYGLIAGLTGAGGQLLLFHALANGPAYLIFPLVSLSPVVTVVLAMALLRERINRLAWWVSSRRWRRSCCSAFPAVRTTRTRTARGC